METRLEEEQNRPKKLFKRLLDIFFIVAFLNLMPFSIFFLVRGFGGSITVGGIFLIQVIAIPALSASLGLIAGILPFNTWPYKMRFHFCFLIIGILSSIIFFLSMLINIWDLTAKKLSNKPFIFLFPPFSDIRSRNAQKPWNESFSRIPFPFLYFKNFTPYFRLTD